MSRSSRAAPGAGAGGHVEVHVSPVSLRQNAPRQLKSCDVTGGGAGRALRAPSAGGGACARRIPRYDGFDNAKIKTIPTIQV